MSSRDPLSGSKSSQSTDPFASTADKSVAANDEFLHGLDTEKELPAHTSSNRGSSSASDKAQQGTSDVKNKTQEAADKIGAKADEVSGKAQQKAGQLSDKADEVTGKAQEKAGEMSDKAQDKADQGIDAAASGLGSAADTIRQQGEQRGGTAGTAAAKTADTLESASKYLRDKDSGQLIDDLESLVRQKPVESLLVAAGVGFILSKLFR